MDLKPVALGADDGQVAVDSRGESKAFDGEGDDLVTQFGLLDPWSRRAGRGNRSQGKPHQPEKCQGKKDQP